MSRWFRTYDDLVDDPKVQRLSDKNFRGLINVWCLASKNEGIIPSIEDVAFSLRMSVKMAAQLIADLTAANLIDQTERGPTPHNWSGRQFKSDTSNERVKRYRERQRNGVCNVTGNGAETPPESESDSDTEQREGGKHHARKRTFRQEAGLPLPSDWQPTDADIEFAKAQGLTEIDIARAAQKFRNYHRRTGSVRSDWPETWQDWVIEDARKFDRTPASASTATKSDFQLTPESPSWSAWRSYFRDTKKDSMVGIMDDLASKDLPFPRQQEWPPGHQIAA